MRRSILIKSKYTLARKSHGCNLSGQDIRIITVDSSYCLKYGCRLILHFRTSCSRVKAQRSLIAVGLLLFESSQVTPHDTKYAGPRNLAMLLLTITFFTFSLHAVYNIALGLALLLTPRLISSQPVCRSLYHKSLDADLAVATLAPRSHAFTLGVFTLANWEFAGIGNTSRSFTPTHWCPVKTESKKPATLCLSQIIQLQARSEQDERPSTLPQLRILSSFNSIVVPYIADA